MKHKRETFKVAVAETSLILRSGVVSAIRRAADCEVLFLEISTPQEFDSKISAYAPDIVIANPLFNGRFVVSEIRDNKSLGLSDTKFIALLSTLPTPSLTDGFDEVINLYDSSDQIHAVLDRAMGYDEPDISSEEEQLSKREKEIICEVVKGYTNKEIADHLNLSVFTVLTHRRNIARKLQIHSSTALAIYAIANKLVSISDVK